MPASLSKWHRETNSPSIGSHRSRLLCRLPRGAAPTLLGLVVFTVTHDFRTLLAPFIGLLLFANYHPRRLTDR